MTVNKTCPNCGAPLPEEASFCPACARSVGRRTRLRVPALRSRGWVMRLAAALVIAAALAAAGSAAAFFLLRPQVYDAMGEVIYTDRDGTYQLLLAWPEDRYQPVPTIAQQVEEGGEYRYPSRLYINSVESGDNMSSLFLRMLQGQMPRLPDRPPLSPLRKRQKSPWFPP